MTGKKKAKHPHRSANPTRKLFGTPPAVKPLAVARPSYIPLDLCSQQIVQSGFSAFATRPAVKGAPLITATDVATASAKTLAAESLVHATEGWRFLSSALTALLAHAQNQAIHFAYYAELRAAVSILASHGLRVRYPTSTYLEKGGLEKPPAWLKEPTHKLVWRLWNDWAATNPAESLFLDSLRVHPAVSLRHVKDAISQVSAAANLKAWARDLQLDHEHTARNEVSYEAANAREHLTFMAPEDFGFVTDLWALAEPTAGGLQFEVQLVHWMLKATADAEEQEELRTSNTPGAGKRWMSRVLLEIERLTGVPTAELETALSLSSPASQVFGYAFSTDVGAKNIISRAFFLLRIANLPIGSAFSQQPGSLGKTWLLEWLEHCGLFDPSAGINAFDLWADYSHLSSLPQPPAPLPNHLIDDPQLAQDTLKLGRPEAVIAWDLLI